MEFVFFIPNKISYFLKIVSIPIIINAVGFAVCKRINFKKSEKAKNLGMLIVCDRFPQTKFEGSDGLKLAKYLDSKNIILRLIARWEENIYNLRENIYPDLVFKIIINPETAIKRKNDGTKIESIIKKNEICKNVIMPENSKIIEVENKNISLEELEKRVINHIWHFIIENKNV